jgi:hypothetical protein
MVIPNHMAGLWADPLTAEEVTFTKQACHALSNVAWAKPLLSEAKISRALNCVPDDCRALDVLLEIKSALFEVRFAYAIYVVNFTGKYEHKTGVGGSSVDFSIFGKDGQRNWLVELTSLHESGAAKESSWQKDNFFGFISRSQAGKNSAEVRDIVKVQQAILHKVANNKAEAIKFPMPNDEVYHVIVVDVRALSIGLTDHLDFHNIAYGSSSLRDIEHGVFCHSWLDENGNSELLRGVFDPSYPDKKAKHLQERVHAVAFVSEKDYVAREIGSRISFWPNPHLVDKEQRKDFCASFPLSIFTTFGHPGD